MEDNLDNLRNLVNRLDDQLLRLLNERGQVAITIGRTKQSSGAKVYDPVRERTVLTRLESLNTGPLSTSAIDEIFAAIIAACREIQNH